MAQDIHATIVVPRTTSSDEDDVLVRTERRINPTWLISELKAKLEPITGIPTHSQEIRCGQTTLSPDSALVGDPAFHVNLNPTLRVYDLRPPAARPNFTDVSAVEKYEMPAEQYEKLDDSVLAWKKRQQLGRFDPGAKSADELVEERRARDARFVQGRGVRVEVRCRVGGQDEKRGVVRFVGEIEGLGGEKERGCVWVGVELDEPVGRNDGGVNVDVGGGKTEKRAVFECRDKFGVFARPEKVEIGAFEPLNDLDDDLEEM